MNLQDWIGRSEHRQDHPDQCGRNCEGAQNRADHRRRNPALVSKHRDHEGVDVPA